MWDVFGVVSPIWGYTTSRTTHDLADVEVVALNDFSEPRIESEIMFGLGSAPAPRDGSNGVNPVALVPGREKLST